MYVEKNTSKILFVSLYQKIFYFYKKWGGIVASFVSLLRASFQL